MSDHIAEISKRLHDEFPLADKVVVVQEYDTFREYRSIVRILIERYYQGAWFRVSTQICLSHLLMDENGATLDALVRECREQFDGIGREFNKNGYAIAGRRRTGDS